MARPRSNSKKPVSSIQSTSPPPKRITSFYSSSINDLISKFENSQEITNQVVPNADHNAQHSKVAKIRTNKNGNSSTRMSNNYSNNLMNNCRVLVSSIGPRICAKSKDNSGSKNTNSIFNYRKWWNRSANKMVDSIGDDVQNDGAEINGSEPYIQPNDDSIETIETFDGDDDDDADGIESIHQDFDIMPLNNSRSNSACDTAPPSKFMRLKNINIVRCQLNIVQRLIGLLMSFPILATVHGAGLSTLTCAFFLPRFLCQTLLYPIFRLVLGTLYPAYASYKAVRNKDVKDYVSIFFCLLQIWDFILKGEPKYREKYENLNRPAPTNII